ncbi:MAG TPA: ABC transporter permease subunit [Thermoanaerobaculia bacterium]|nr:ABC transporter permease subunit [Thermoanaerobaculia bacterium]
MSVVALTLKVAAISTLIVAPLATMIAALSWRSRAGVALDAIATVPLVLPPTAVGFLLLQVLPRDVLFTQVAVVIACAVMSFPLMFVAARAAIDASDVRYFNVARTLGASPLRAFATVTLPLAWRGLLAGVILAFCRAIGEFGATIIIAGNIPGRTQTMALAIYDRINLGHDNEATMFVVCVLVIAVTAIIASELLVRRQRRLASR